MNGFKFSLKKICQMTDQEANSYLELLRFSGKPKCVKCGHEKVYLMKKERYHNRYYRCASCAADFSSITDTVFHGRRMPLRDWLALCFVFISSAQGTSSAQIARLLGIEQKSAYMSAMKLREVLLRESQSIMLHGTVEIDGGIFGGHRKAEASVRPAFGRRFYHLNSKQRRCLVVAKQRLGRTLIFVGKKESDALDFIKEKVAAGSIIQVDGGQAWEGLAHLYDTLVTEHLYTFGTNVQHTNNAESFFAAFRKMHRGVHHHMNGDYMSLYAAELAFKRDHNDLTVNQLFHKFMTLCLTQGKQSTWRNPKATIVLRAA